jgi:hypothetical protein
MVQSHAASPDQTTTVPFELINRHIVVDAAINGRPLSFVLDTGDRVGIIDLDRAKTLGLTLGREVKVGGVGASQMTGYFLDGATVTLQALPRLPQPLVVALPLAPLATRLGHAFDGILGGDFIRQFVVEIDYAKRILTLHDHESFTYAGTGERVPIHLNASGHPIVQASVTPLGGQPITGSFVIDIGSGLVVALNRPFASAHHLPAAGDPTFRAMGVGGAGGEGSGRFGRLAALQIGHARLARPMTLFSEDQAGAFANPALTGNIGYEILSRFHLFLDYERQQIIFEPAAGFDAPFNRLSSGFTFETRPDDYHFFTVTGILEASPAAEAGLRVGDVLTAVDAQPASDLTLTSIVELFQQPVRRSLTLTRQGASVTVALTPRLLVE